MTDGQWRSIDEGRGREPGGIASPVFPGPVDRRQFLRLVEAALAAAGLSGCTLQPPQKALPYVVPPEGIEPGRPTYYATTMPFAGYGLGVLGECHLGRPTKLDGNPEHPATRGRSNVFLQAAILDLYDPDRTRTVREGSATRSWADFEAALAAQLERAGRGAGIRIVTEGVTSPTLAAQLRGFLARYPDARWLRAEPTADDAAPAGAELALGRVVEAVYHFDRAARILSLDGDFLADGPAGIRYAYDFGRSRDVVSHPEAMSRLYVLETTTSITGATADHRRGLRPSELDAAARMLARRILRVSGEDELPALASWLDAAARDLDAHAGASVVVAGRGASPAAHALAHAMNHALGAFGRTVSLLPRLEEGEGAHGEALATLASDLAGGKVSTLLVLEANPVYQATRELPLAALVAKAPFSACASRYDDETMQACRWRLPASHFLEAWGDARAFDGTLCVQQPLIRPLYPTRTPLELLGGSDGYGLVRARWQELLGGGDFERRWHDTVARGFVEGSAPAPFALRPRVDAIRGLLAPRLAVTSELEAVFRPDATVWDGRFANNAWLQETPKPQLTLTWDNAALIGPETAARLGVRSEDVVKLTLGEVTVDAPVLVMPGTPNGTIGLALGYGRAAGGRNATGRGVAANALRTRQTPWSAPGLHAAPTHKRHALALTQNHHTMESRQPVEVRRFDELAPEPARLGAALTRVEPAAEETLYPSFGTGPNAWGMAIDLNQCIGCNACIVACQSENNIPTVGKEQVAMGREMHWIRVDRYFEGPARAPRVHSQPVPCMHCEKAPCELVCPVGATVHDSQGLNEMVYNRCVGTRYCSNNCPYKVRRFNYLRYAPARGATETFAQNPDVSVRERGVMEKCTYCIQRIVAARIAAEKESRPIRDGEVVPACAAACPTGTIVFGDAKDPATEVSRYKREPRRYDLLAGLNTRPRTSYLAKLVNRNPELGAITEEES